MRSGTTTTARHRARHQTGSQSVAVEFLVPAGVLPCPAGREVPGPGPARCPAGGG
ncbi:MULTISPECIES: hypothetical protein [Streptomyces]|uniref:hypothetical protein n=1 Tax=Streptomyces TaxID=1883 RepID=UPI0016718C62|nr:hypothetical protein [Streptomyces canarius]